MFNWKYILKTVSHVFIYALFHVRMLGLKNERLKISKVSELGTCVSHKIVTRPSRNRLPTSEDRHRTISWSIAVCQTKLVLQTAVQRRTCYICVTVPHTSCREKLWAVCVHKHSSTCSNIVSRAMNLNGVKLDIEDLYTSNVQCLLVLLTCQPGRLGKHRRTINLGTKFFWNQCRVIAVNLDICEEDVHTRAILTFAKQTLKIWWHTRNNSKLIFEISL